jgi:cytochrome bd ubiquinol oxidase subunit I
MTLLAELDVVMLSRWQFALTIMFHYLFPPLTIGMGVVLVYLEGMFLRTGDVLYEQAARFWTKIFAVNFAIGVATGIVMEFEFGTNWAMYSRFVGDVFGSALAAEGIFAFFLESGFLAVLVFGWDRVGPRFHFFATVMVALGSIFSAIWIVVANSWQQTPAGHHIVPMMRNGTPWVVDGVPVRRAEIVDFWAMVFNPSTIHRLVHVWIGCFILGAAFIMSVSAWYILRRRHEEFARRSFTGALMLATVSSLAMLLSGHFQAQNV